MKEPVRIDPIWEWSVVRSWQIYKYQTCSLNSEQEDGKKGEGSDPTHKRALIDPTS